MFEIVSQLDLRRQSISSSETQYWIDVMSSTPQWGHVVTDYISAGGGGRSKARKSKLRTKNEKLNEQRKRKAYEEANSARKFKIEEQGKQSLDAGNIHPSRVRRVEKTGY